MPSSPDCVMLISGEAAGGNMKLITRGSERVKLVLCSYAKLLLPSKQVMKVIKNITTLQMSYAFILYAAALSYIQKYT